MRLNTYIILTLLITTQLCMAQPDSIQVQHTEKNDKELWGFINYEVYPVYKHGTNEELMNLVYEQIEMDCNSNLHGTIILKVTINEEGKIESPEIIKLKSTRSSPEIESQLKEIIMQFEFVPGTQRGKPTPCVWNFPIKLGWL